MTITKINNFSQLEHLSPLEPGREGYLILDFDQTIARPTIDLVDDLFLAHLGEMKDLARLMDRRHFPHREWFTHSILRRYFTQVPHETTDPNVKRIIQLFRQKGWNIRVLTNRNEDAEECTHQHIQQAGLDIDPDECCFRDDDSYAKGGRFLRLVPDRPARVIFVDDDPINCKGILDALDERPLVQAEIFEYAIPPLTQKTLPAWWDRLAVQLLHHCQGTLFSEIDYSPASILRAKEQLELPLSHEPRSEFIRSFVKACMKIAEKDGFPVCFDSFQVQAPPKRPKTEKKEE